MRLILAGCLLLLAPAMARGMSPITFEIDKTARFRIQRVDYDRTSHWDVCVFRPAPRENYKPGLLGVTLDRGGGEPLRVALATGESPEGCTAFSFDIPAAAVHDIRLMVMDTGSGYTGNWQFYSGPVDELPEWKPPLKFTDYDPALGQPTSTDAGDSTFPGEIEINGYLDVERDGRPACKQGCVGLVPNSDDPRLPHVLIESCHAPYPFPVLRIDLGPAREALAGSLPPAELDRLLRPSAEGYYPSVTLRLRRLHVKQDEGVPRYEAKMVSLKLDTGPLEPVETQPIPNC